MIEKLKLIWLLLVGIWLFFDFCKGLLLLCYNEIMEKTADVVIIGGGVIGFSIAYHLGKKAGKIVLLEKGQLGEGSTSRCVGGIRTQFSTEINIRFSLESMKTFDQFEEEFGVNPEFKRIGYLFLATTELEMRSL